MYNGCVEKSPERSYQVEVELSTMESKLSDLRDVLGTLENRLLMVCPEDTAKQVSVMVSPPREMLVPLANRLRDQNEIIDVVRERLLILRDKIEL